MEPIIRELVGTTISVPPETALSYSLMTHTIVLSLLKNQGKIDCQLKQSNALYPKCYHFCDSLAAVYSCLSFKAKEPPS